MDGVARRSTLVAWAMLGVFVVTAGTGTALEIVNGDLHEDPAGEFTLLVAFSAFMIVGAVIVARRPENSIGWIFSSIGLLAGTGVLAWTYAEHVAATGAGSAPGAVLAAWYSAWFWYPLMSLAIVFTPLVFPTGRVLSSRWRPVAVVTVAAVAVTVVMHALQPTLGDGVTVRNPIGISGVIADSAAEALDAVVFGLLTACSLAAALSLLLRFRRSHGVERQQIKWFVYAGALTACSALLGDFFPDIGVLDVLFGVAIGLLPMAAGIAILRYRLYDIDHLIRRTVSYSLLTAVLGAVYAAVVVIAGQVFGGVGGHPPSWLIAAATLAVAGLFQPARRRIQAHVDRRFNRSRYDAAQTVGTFTARLRDELDPDTISVQLLATVGRTMQPTAASLWLRTVDTARR